MTFLPHPEIPYKIVHTGDIILLLSFGLLYELCVRVYQHRNERRTPKEHRLAIHLAALRHEAAKKRALGPSAFVETSKLERAVLATEKDFAKMVEEKESRKAHAAKVIKKCNLATNGMILLVYWGVAMVVIDGSRVSTNNDDLSYDDHTDVERASAFWKAFLFPLSYNGLSYKIAQYGIQSNMRPACLGALTVFWAARVTCGEIFSCALDWSAT